MQLNIAICDDEHTQIEYLQKVVLAWSNTTKHQVKLMTFPSAKAFLFEYSENKTFDILLLDIEMGEINGIELAKKLRSRHDNSQIIFITGYPDFISEGYEVAALHYLMKPVSEAKLRAVLDRAASNISAKETSLLINTDDGIMRIELSDIMAAEVLSHDITLHTTDGLIHIRMSLNELISKLDSRFVRCHRSSLVGLHHVKQITKTDVILDSGALIPLSRRMYDEVNRQFISYYKGELS